MFDPVKRAEASTNPRQLTRLSKHPDYRVRMAVAANPATPAQVLETLVAAERSMREQMNQHPPGLIRVSDAFIRTSMVASAVAKNPNAPVELLEVLVREGHVEEVALRVDLPPSVIAAYQQTRWAYVASWFARLASERPMSDHTLKDYNPQVLDVIARAADEQLRHTSLDRQWMLAWMDHGRKGPTPKGHSVRELLAGLDHLPSSTFAVLAQSDDVPALTALVRRQPERLVRTLPTRAVQLLVADGNTTTLAHLSRYGLLSDDQIALLNERLDADRQARERAQKDADERADARRPGHREPHFDSPAEAAYWRAVSALDPPELRGLKAQHAVGRFRVDFALVDRKIGVEIDGFRYHSSQENIISDRQRQRTLEQSGWRIVRFAAKEVLDNPQLCVRQTVTLIKSI